MKLRTLAAVAALFVLAGGGVHLYEWGRTYRFIPDAIPGAAVVRTGFVLNAGLAVLVAAALFAAARSRRANPWLGRVAAAALAFEVASIATLVLSRTGTVFGWSETGLSGGAMQALAFESVAVLLLGGLLAGMLVRPSVSPAVAAGGRL